MMHKAWSSREEVPYYFARSSVKFQRRTALKIIKFDPDWAFPDCNSSLNSPMAMKCCTKLETAKERCHFVFQGHPSNFKVTRYKTSLILTQIGRFRTIGRSQLSNPSDLPCFCKHGKLPLKDWQKHHGFMTDVEIMTSQCRRRWVLSKSYVVMYHNAGAQNLLANHTIWCIHCFAIEAKWLSTPVS